MMAIIRPILWGAAVALIVAIAVVTTSDVRKLQQHSKSIQAQTDKLREIRDERARQKLEIEAIGEEMAALPDSIRPHRMGTVMRRSRELAKRQEQLDSREVGIQRSIRNFEAAQAEVRRHLIRWDLPLAGGLVLVGAALGLTRRSRR